MNAMSYVPRFFCFLSTREQSEAYTMKVPTTMPLDNMPSTGAVQPRRRPSPSPQETPQERALELRMRRRRPSEKEQGPYFLSSALTSSSSLRLHVERLALVSFTCLFLAFSGGRLRLEAEELAAFSLFWVVSLPLLWNVQFSTAAVIESVAVMSMTSRFWAHVFSGFG